MAIFTRKDTDPAQKVYRQMAREKAMKRQFDFIGKTGKMDPEVEDTPKYKRAEKRFEDEINKPLEEGWKGDQWWPTADASSIETMNSNKPDEVAAKSDFLRNRIADRRNSYGYDRRHESGALIEEMHMPYSEKHKLATQMLHHDFLHPTDPHFHDSKTPVDKVLEEMTRYRPNADNRERIRNAIDTFKKSDPNLHSYLKDKYKFATEDEEVGPFKNYEPSESILTSEEVNKYKDTHVFTHGRTISEPWKELGKSMTETKKWQIHPDGTKTRVSAILPHTTGSALLEPKDHPFVDPEEHARIQEFHHNNLNDLHGEFASTTSYTGMLEAYTKNSRGLNQYIAKGKLDPYEDDSSEIHYDNMSDTISKALRDSPPYAHKIQVWTGVSKSNDIGAYAAKKIDDKEKLVGHFPAFTSTSLNAKEAADFAKEKDAQGFPHQPVRDMMRIDVPKAYHRGMYVAKIAQYPKEQEYLMDKGHTFEVHPKPMYYVKNLALHRVWKARPILSDEDKNIVQQREKNAREF